MGKFIEKVHLVFADLEGKNIATKHPPEKIDRVLYLVITDLFNKYYDNYVKTKKISDYLLPFKKTQTLSLTNGLVELPTDYYHHREIYLMDGTTELAQVEIIEDKFWPKRSKRSLGGPSMTRPIGRIEISESDSKKVLQVLPANVATVKMQYFKVPSEPKYAYTTSGTRYVYDEANSIDIEFPQGLYQDIIFRLLSNFGIVLREGQLIQVSEMIKAQDQVK